MTKLVLKTTRYSWDHAFFCKKIQKMKRIGKMVAFWGFSRNRGGEEGGDGDGVLNSNHRGTGKGKTAGDLGERVLRVPRGIPS